MKLKDILKRFLPFFKDYKMHFVIVIIGMLLAAGGSAAAAWVIEPVLNKIFVDKNKELLYILPYAVILIYFLKGLGTFLQAYFTAYIGQDVVRRFRDKLLDNLINLDMSFFYEYRVGELISRNISDIERIRGIVSNIIPEFLRELITIIGLLCVVFYQSVQLAFFALIIMPLAAYPLSILAKKMKKVSRASQEKNSDISSKLNEIFTNIELIKANNAQKYECKNFAEQNRNFLIINLKSVKIVELVSPMMETFGSIGIAIVIIIGGGQVIDGNITMGSFFSFVTALFMLYTPVKRLSKLYNSMQDAVVAADRTFELLDKTTRIQNGDKEIPDEIQSIEFKNVALKYDDKSVLRGVSFEALKSQTIAMVGASGGGKTSLMNLLMRFYDTSGGEILINGVNLREFDVPSLRKNIGLVTQRVYIFNDSIANNVAYGKEFDETAVINALKLANAYEFVSELENGIYEVLNEFGTNLSGGQRQRIAIARALYANPQILIFDEATSALDNESEKEITRAINNLRNKKIIFVIAHRLSTIEQADKIAVLKEGKIVGFDSDSKLLQNCEYYAKLKGKAIV
ncbi:MAG: ABC transporter ATP-binding protein/permease [Campylobacter sp.]|nr:ABC transporter ATP-binding protein/permease [Campylobacter sp.]